MLQFTLVVFLLEPQSSLKFYSDSHISLHLFRFDTLGEEGAFFGLHPRTPRLGVTPVLALIDKRDSFLAVPCGRNKWVLALALERLLNSTGIFLCHEGGTFYLID